MITSKDLKRPGMTPVLPSWDLGIMLEALSQFSYVQTKGGSCYSILALGQLLLYSSPEFIRKYQRSNQVSQPWYIPGVPTGKPDLGAPNCPVGVRYYHKYMTEHPELRKGRRHLFIPFKDNNVGK